jgi:hypothetical protein
MKGKCETKRQTDYTAPHGIRAAQVTCYTIRLLISTIAKLLFTNYTIHDIIMIDG